MAGEGFNADGALVAGADNGLSGVNWVSLFTASVKSLVVVKEQACTSTREERTASHVSPAGSTSGKCGAALPRSGRGKVRQRQIDIVQRDSAGRRHGMNSGNSKVDVRVMRMSWSVENG